MSKLDIRKRFLKLAYEQLNPNLSSIDGLEQALSNWYCFQYNVPPNDDKLLDMTLEELMVLHQMHKLRENPALIDEITTSVGESYEDWLKREMGEDYVSDDDMVKELEEVEQKEKEEVAKRYPDVVTTDFSQFNKGE